MADYKESEIMGTKWQRCRQVVLDNPLGVPPTIRFDEQEILSLEGREIRRNAGSLSVPFDAERSIALRDPATGKATGATATYGNVYLLIYSAYIDAALARDEAAAPVTQSIT